MAGRPPTTTEYRRIYATLAYQFDERVARALTSPPGELKVELSGTGRVRYVWRGDSMILTLRASDGLFALSIEACNIIARAVEPPRFRVVIMRGEAGNIKGNIMRPVVVDLDPGLRPGDEVIVVDEDDIVVGVGKLKLPPLTVKNLEKGEIVRVRKLAREV
ncbi:MAG: PUA domain-containing protein [Acidilobaceae archaeon]